MDRERIDRDGECDEERDGERGSEMDRERVDRDGERDGKRDGERDGERGMLSASNRDLVTQKTIQQYLNFTDTVNNCFEKPHYINLLINSTLKIPEHGWTYVQRGIEKALKEQGADQGIQPNLIIGPFYTNLAIVLQKIKIPYIMTAYKGFDWIDMSRVQDTIKWKTLIEIRPPAADLNRAIVDYFIVKQYESALMIMPESAADNQECHNLAATMLNNSLSLIPFTVDPSSSAINESVSEVLRNAQLSSQQRIIVCSPRDTRDNLIRKVLVKARSYGMLHQPDMTFFFMDPASYYEPFSGASKMYELGLFSRRCELLAYRYIRPEGTTIEENNAAAIDTAKLTSLALDKYLRLPKSNKDVIDNEKFLRVIRETNFTDGRTGKIYFDKNGQRKNFNLYLYDHGGEESMYKTIARWGPNGATSDLRLNLTNSTQHDNGDREYGIMPDLVRIVVVEEDPFVIRRSEPILGDYYEGFSIDLIKRLAQELKFKYELYVSPGNVYGAKNLLTNQWDGMVNEVLSGNATLACGAISITSARETVIDFSLGVFMMPFSLELWMAILGASTLVTIVFFAMDYCSEEDRRFTLKETIWFTIGTLLKRGTDFAPVPISQRILTAGFLFFVLITVSTYTANMAAFLTIKNFGESVNSFETLAESKKIGVSTVINSATMAFLKNDQGQKNVYKKIWSKVLSSNGQVVNASEGMKKVKKGTHAFIFDYLINEAFQNRHCDVMAVSNPILLQEHGIGMMAGAPFKSHINIALLKLKEEGFMARMKKKWWDDKRECEVGSDSQRTGEVKFSVEHTAGVFIVGLFGVCVAAMLFISKKVWLLILGAFRKHQKRRNKQTSSPGQDSPINNGMEEAKRERLRLYVGDKGEAV
ncbi:glutamate receptor ionotropic kainate 2 [Biomphalaria pfeifferi]|uniref:Glutamate receptor ionotropic kainate 2 n=1 Tax=Biomphalaria pfeifferi TaxID=112525 RepID=A0AAD8BTF6_BIOPF|nr:glutamate receptor ionotropic kainate 2 [Biomphalaria pfeifferi]